MQGDLIDRKQLCTELEILCGELYNEEVIRGIKIAIDVIKDMQTAYFVEKVIEQIEAEKEVTYNRCIKGMYDAMFKDFIGIVSNGGKE